MEYTETLLLTSIVSTHLASIHCGRGCYTTGCGASLDVEVSHQANLQVVSR